MSSWEDGDWDEDDALDEDEAAEEEEEWSRSAGHRRGGKSGGKRGGKRGGRQGGGKGTPRSPDIEFELDITIEDIFKLEKLGQDDAKEMMRHIVNTFSSDSFAEWIGNASDGEWKQLQGALQERLSLFMPQSRTELVDVLSEHGMELKDSSASSGARSSGVKRSSTAGNTGERRKVSKLGRNSKKGHRGDWQEQGADGKTGANTIEVKWKPPPKEEDEKVVKAPPVEKSPSPPSVRGPAGRGMGNTLPSWMTRGVSDVPPPSIPDVTEPKPAAEEQGPHILDSIFEERDTEVPERKRSRSRGRRGKGKGGRRAPKRAPKVEEENHDNDDDEVVDEEDDEEDENEQNGTWKRSTRTTWSNRNETWGKDKEEDWGNKSKHKEEDWGNKSKHKEEDWGNKSKYKEEDWGNKSKDTEGDWGNKSKDTEEDWGNQNSSWNRAGWSKDSWSRDSWNTVGQSAPWKSRTWNSWEEGSDGKGKGKGKGKDTTGWGKGWGKGWQPRKGNLKEKKAGAAATSLPEAQQKAIRVITESAKLRGVAVPQFPAISACSSTAPPPAAAPGMPPPPPPAKNTHTECVETVTRLRLCAPANQMAFAEYCVSTGSCNDPKNMTEAQLQAFLQLPKLSPPPELVSLVRSLHLSFPKAWTEWCKRQGAGMDPAQHSLVSLQRFIDSVDVPPADLIAKVNDTIGAAEGMQAWLEHVGGFTTNPLQYTKQDLHVFLWLVDKVWDELSNQVKEFQKQSPDNAKKWEVFCTAQGIQELRLAWHTNDLLRRFLHYHGVLVPEGNWDDEDDTEEWQEKDESAGDKSWQDTKKDTEEATPAAEVPWRSSASKAATGNAQGSWQKWDNQDESWEQKEQKEPKAYADPETLNGTRLIGTIKRVSTSGDKKFGFIACDDVEGDLYFSAAWLPEEMWGAEDLVGRQLTFELLYEDKGRLKAKHLRAMPTEGRQNAGAAASIVTKPITAVPPKPPAAAAAAPPENLPEGRSFGKIKNWLADKGCGFICSQEVDTDIHFKNLPDNLPDSMKGDLRTLLPGKEVTFFLHWSWHQGRERPQADNLRLWMFESGATQQPVQQQPQLPQQPQQHGPPQQPATPPPSMGGVASNAVAPVVRVVEPRRPGFVAVIPPDAPHASQAGGADEVPKAANMSAHSMKGVQVGTIALFDPMKKFGFLAVEGYDGRVFFHASDLPADMPQDLPVIGQKMRFDAQQSEKGPRSGPLQRAAGSAASAAPPLLGGGKGGSQAGLAGASVAGAAGTPGTMGTPGVLVIPPGGVKANSGILVDPPCGRGKACGKPCGAMALQGVPQMAPNPGVFPYGPSVPAPVAALGKAPGGKWQSKGGTSRIAIGAPQPNEPQHPQLQTPLQTQPQAQPQPQAQTQPQLANRRQQFGPELGTFSGIVHRFDQRGGFGFIESQRLRAVTGRPGYVHITDLGRFVVGDRVTFRAFERRGHAPLCADLEADTSPPESATQPPDGTSSTGVMQPQAPRYPPPHQPLQAPPQRQHQQPPQQMGSTLGGSAMGGGAHSGGASGGATGPSYMLSGGATGPSHADTGGATGPSHTDTLDVTGPSHADGGQYDEEMPADLLAEDEEYHLEAMQAESEARAELERQAEALAAQASLAAEAAKTAMMLERVEQASASIGESSSSMRSAVAASPWDVMDRIAEKTRQWSSTIDSPPAPQPQQADRALPDQFELEGYEEEGGVVDEQPMQFDQEANVQNELQGEAPGNSDPWAETGGEAGLPGSQGNDDAGRGLEDTWADSWDAEVGLGGETAPHPPPDARLGHGPPAIRPGQMPGAGCRPPPLRPPTFAAGPLPPEGPRPGGPAASLRDEWYDDEPDEFADEPPAAGTVARQQPLMLPAGGGRGRPSAPGRPSFPPFTGGKGPGAPRPCPPRPFAPRSVGGCGFVPRPGSTGRPFHGKGAPQAGTRPLPPQHAMR